jgi:hypothetical protein
MTDTGRELISRRHFLEMLGISDSNERRKRKEGHPWPPHLRIGTKVYYRRSAVDDFLRAQGALCQTQPGEPTVECQGALPEFAGQVDQPERDRVSLDAALSSDTVGDDGV